MSILRWLLIIFLFYLIIRVLKGFIAPRSVEGPARPKTGEQDSRELVRDPFCGVYFPRSEGVAQLFEGQVLYFHSADCRDKYIEARRGDSKGGNE